MSRAAGYDCYPLQAFSRIVFSKSREIYYIGGSDILPAPLEPQREAVVIEDLNSDNANEARSLLIEHNLRLVVYIAKSLIIQASAWKI
jgi:RNA polymerase sporulation-specific sigma factor